MEATTGFLLWRVSTKWRAAVDRAVAPLGLTHAQFSLLGALSGLSRSGQRPRQRELAEHTGLEPIFVSKLARALEKSGLVERPTDPDDPRAVRVTLTEHGQRIAMEAAGLVHELHTQLTAPLGGPEAPRTLELCEILLDLLDETPATQHGRNEDPMTRTFNGRDINEAAVATREVLTTLLAKAGLSFAEWAALRAAAERPAVRADLVADVVRPGMVLDVEIEHALHQLEEGGLVQSTDEEEVGATAKGIELFERITSESAHVGDQLFEGIDEAEIQVAQRVLRQVTQRATKVRAQLG
ncbi:winged helix DNA-binding protein [Amycolatopsis acidicola]|uniref:Winged helix DNA-binding protein n=1 Tax=Amycolatopsis acidicola TaxID=2596893 RepID=A0A5N0US59_9PSEU|nr:MarR family transcriptional regulator [Amycolatopsis acidicola]KAA9154600.1 winged helix DNA-binding protein [Amycolatopsis acidicola]